MKTQINKLYVLSTPIGNLNDASNNLIETLNNLDYIFCEDTRVSKNLLDKLNIKKNITLISYHKFNEIKKLDEIINLIINNKCGLMSDAGYPSINDPGYILINKCHELNIKVEVIDGPCSLIHAIVQSGFCNNGFIFLGFIEREQNKIINQINKYINNNLPLIFLESIHRINSTIDILAKYFPDNDIYIGRELTKLHEEYIINKASKINKIIEKGETILIIKPIINDNKQKNVINKIILDDLNELIKLGLNTKNACKYIGSKNNLSSNELYNYLLKNKK